MIFLQLPSIFCDSDFQKIAALIHEFLLKLDEDPECAEVRDSLNYSLLQLQRYFRLLRNRNMHQSPSVQTDQSAGRGSNSLLGQSLRGLSPMTPFRDAPDKFLWRWIDLESSSVRTVGTTLPARLDKESCNVPNILRAARQSDNNLLVQLIERGSSLSFDKFCNLCHIISFHLSTLWNRQQESFQQVFMLF